MKFVLHNITEEPLIFSELKVKEYKDILKSTYGDKPCLEGFLETLYDVLFSLGNKERNFYKELNVFQLFQILTKIRIFAFGEECSVSITKEGANCTLHLNLENILEDTKKSLENFQSINVEEDGVCITFGIPTPERFISKIEDEYLYFITSFTAKNKTILVKDNSSAKMLVDKLSPKFTLKLIKHYMDLADTLKSVNLLKRYQITEQKLVFAPSIESLLWFTKLYFNEALDSFYESIFFLCHEGNIDANYIERCTPGEYIFLAKKLIATIKEKNKAQQENNQHS